MLLRNYFKVVFSFWANITRLLKYLSALTGVVGFSVRCFLSAANDFTFNFLSNVAVGMLPSSCTCSFRLDSRAFLGLIPSPSLLMNQVEKDMRIFCPLILSNGYISSIPLLTRAIAFSSISELVLDLGEYLWMVLSLTNGLSRTYGLIFESRIYVLIHHYGSTHLKDHCLNLKSSSMFA